MRWTERNTLTVPEIDRLNQRAAALRNVREDDDGERVGDMEVGEALQRVIDEEGFVEVGDDEACTVYRAADGRLVNCWSHGPQSYEIQNGGAGFDDQIESVETGDEENSDE